MSQARDLHALLGIADGQVVSFSDISAFEKQPDVVGKVLYHSRGDWRYFHTCKEVTDHKLYLLHHEDHYNGMKGVKGFIGESYFCEKCISVYDHKNNPACQYFCGTCQRTEGPNVVNEYVRCPCCRVYCRSGECLEIHKKLARDDLSFCRLKIYCERWFHFVP
ncbi:hypothetical protein PRIEUP_LOCUS1148 [Pristimantis euphronides]